MHDFCVTANLNAMGAMEEIDSNEFFLVPN